MPVDARKILAKINRFSQTFRLEGSPVYAEEKIRPLGESRYDVFSRSFAEKSQTVPPDGLNQPKEDLDRRGSCPHRWRRGPPTISPRGTENDTSATATVPSNSLRRFWTSTRISAMRAPTPRYEGDGRTWIQIAILSRCWSRPLRLAQFQAATQWVSDRMALPHSPWEFSAGVLRFLG